jgi:hypothetical protein
LAVYQADESVHGKRRNGRVVRPESEVHDRCQKEVAGQDSNAIPPEAVCGGPVTPDSRTIHDVIMKKGPVVESLHEGSGFCKVRCRLAKQSSGQTEEVGSKTFPLCLKNESDDGVQPVAGRVESRENFIGGQTGNGDGENGLCALLLG